jgi:predicted DNA-binding transcriptional regulator YafY
MPRGEQIIRHWNLLRTLQTRGEGVPLARLAEEFGVSERTIQRDFELLEELGFPVDFNEDDYGKRFWRLPPDYLRTGSLVLSLTEAVSLHLAEGLFAPLSGTHFADGLESALAKIRALVPARALDYFSGLGDILQVRPFAATDYSALKDFIRAFDQGAQECRSVEVEYRSLWRDATYTTLYDPYGLVLHLDDLFAVGWSHRADAIRIFKLSRVRSAALTDRPFERPADFDLAGFFRSSFGIVQADREPVEIAVQFTGVAAAVVEERIWHDSQRLEWLPAEANLFDREPHETEALVATFRLAEVIEFKRWLKGFGDQAVVLQPHWLREEIRQELLAAAQQYGSQASTP